MQKRPFIYIASLRRTGGTVLSEALTMLPYSFIFLEPNLGKNKFRIRENDHKLFLQLGIDLEEFKQKYLTEEDNSFIKIFKEELLTKLDSNIHQIGVKEIHNKGWQNYYRVFNDMKVILTARDPRDIYISLYYRKKQGKGSWKKELTPETLSTHLNNEFNRQLEMYEQVKCLRIKYEELCTDREIYQKIKTFVESEIPDTGTIGSFNAANVKRRDEYELHGNFITDKRVQRWQQEQDKSLVSEASKIIGLMPHYCDFWGYKK
ncbi:MAG: sulfotransferase [Candidatus Kuenenia sp.]|nr:sulfotransferase [Candidatus Kuenenia hertensis]